MTSSPPKNEGSKPPGWRQPWDLWRVLMLVGSLVLLGLAFSRSGGASRLPEWFEVGLHFLGYVLLAVGFFLAMRTRRQLRERRDSAEKERVTPPDPG